MDLVSAWRRQLLRASGAVLIVPLAVVMAVAAVGVGGGGFGGAASLGQLVSGPAAPDTGGMPGGRGPDAREIASAADDIGPAAAPAAGGVGSGAGGGVTGGGGTGGGGGGTRGGEADPPASINQPRTGPRRGTPRTPATPTPTPETPATPTTPTPPAPTRGPLAPVGDATKPVTDALPQPIGETVKDLVGGLTGSN